MRIGMVGLGRMGSNMVRRLLRGEHEVVVFDVDPEAVARVQGEGAVAARSIDALAAALDAPRAVWVMVPAGPVTEATIGEVARSLTPGDVVVDGGNSRYSDTVARHASLQGEASSSSTRGPRAGPGDSRTATR